MFGKLAIVPRRRVKQSIDLGNTLWVITLSTPMYSTTHENPSDFSNSQSEEGIAIVEMVDWRPSH